jgi:radical SAM/Cys-rich protein
MLDAPTVLSNTTNRFVRTVGELRRGKTEVLQINVGKLCNQTCVHCHVNAGPGRKEVMTRETMDRIVDWLAGTDIGTVDITGGAPEIIPGFRHLVERLKALERHVMDRCNLTIFFEPGYEDLPEFLAKHHIEVIASLPCYTAGNVDAQRGNGVFEKSIRALQRLNELGYGTNPALRLNLVYNPLGAKLPGPQAELEADYHAELKEHFGIVFHRLYTITNMPIARFAAWLHREGRYDDYMRLLVENFNAAAVEGLMCRRTLSVGWRGEVYDCDFNQMLEMPWRNGRPLFLWDVEPAAVAGRPIQTGDHCFGCTAGAGSSCTGAVVKNPCPPPAR